MPRGMASERALERLVHAQNEAGAEREKRAELAQQAVSILRAKGEYLFIKDGLWGGIDGLIGSANPGFLVTQATAPMEVENSYVALRDQATDKSSAIELVSVHENDPAAVRDTNNVLAVMEGGLVIPGLEEVTDEQRWAVGVLLDSIDVMIEPVDLPRSYHGKQVTPRAGALTDAGIINVRKHPEQVDELFRPRIRGLGF